MERWNIRNEAVALTIANIPLLQLSTIPLAIGKQCARFIVSFRQNFIVLRDLLAKLGRDLLHIFLNGRRAGPLLKRGER